MRERNICKNYRAFTLIEILIVVGIILLISAASAPIYSKHYLSTQLSQASSLLVQSLRTARERSVVQYNQSSHGVYLEINSLSDDSFIIYQGASYATRNSLYDRQTGLDSGLELSSTILGGDLNFSKLLGSPYATGTITITHSVDGSEVLNINQLGVIDKQ